MAVEQVVVQQIISVAEKFPARPCFEGAVETWLRHSLTARYDATLAESLPSDLVALLGISN